jgi:hypothetical protein
MPWGSGAGWARVLGKRLRSAPGRSAEIRPGPGTHTSWLNGDEPQRSTRPRLGAVAFSQPSRLAVALSGAVGSHPGPLSRHRGSDGASR